MKGADFGIEQMGRCDPHVSMWCTPARVRKRVGGFPVRR